MKRNLVCEAIVLKNNPIGEIHKGVVLLTREHGILHAVAHGALKGNGKLRNLTAPFTLAVCYLYHEPVKDSYKVSDMESLRFYEGLRENLVRFYAASLWAELALKSFGAGESSEPVFLLLRDGLSVLDRMPEPMVDFSIVQYLWRFMRISGILPELEECGMCGRPFEAKESIYLKRGDPSFLCVHCRGDLIECLSPGARRYLEHTEPLSFEKAMQVQLDRSSTVLLKRMLLLLVQDHIEEPLKTLQAGEGIL